MLKAETFRWRPRLRHNTSHRASWFESSRPEAAEWDAFVEAVPGGDVVQTAAWAETKKALGFEACLVLVRDGGALVGGGHIIIKRFGPLGGVGYVARGPLMAGVFSSRIAEVLDKIERVARARRVRHLIVQPPEGGDEIAALLAARGYTPDAPDVAPSATMRIDLSQDLDRVLAAMSSSTRRQIRRSQKLGVEVRTGGRHEVELFHALYAATARRQRFEPLSLAYLRKQWDVLAPDELVQMFFASHEGRVLAAVWLTAFRDTVTNRLAGWTGEARQLQPNVACCWGAMQWAKEQGYRRFDFSGIPRADAELMIRGEPLPEAFQRSPGAFKREFGASPVLLPSASQFTFNPVARFFVRSVCPLLLRPEGIRWVVQRLRSGAVRLPHDARPHEPRAHD
jgi:lipid II:glycine glycyltransferase (peptidoglycan interpeptide bridge formation enzyme)